MSTLKSISVLCKNKQAGIEGTNWCSLHNLDWKVLWFFLFCFKEADTWEYQDWWGGGDNGLMDFESPCNTVNVFVCMHAYLSFLIISYLKEIHYHFFTSPFFSIQAPQSHSTYKNAFYWPLKEMAFHFFTFSSSLSKAMLSSSLNGVAIGGRMPLRSKVEELACRLLMIRSISPLPQIPGALCSIFTIHGMLCCSTLYAIPIECFDNHC